ncbi:MAG: ribonuclease D [Gemmatimonadaceae bacterium]
MESQHKPLYLDQPEATSRFLATIADVPAIALDTEGASFHRFVDRIYLLQLSTRDVSAIIDPLAVTSLTELGRLLVSPATEIVFHDADYDLRLLHQDYGWHVTNIFDTRIAAQLLGLKSIGLAALLEQYFGVKLDKKHQRADWSVRPLTRSMLDYAAQDTMYLLQLREILKGALERLGRWEWVTEEFQRLEGTRWEPDTGGEATDDDANAFMRVKGARDLSRRALAIFRELILWREAKARELDRATFRVVGNEPLLAAAQRTPGTVAELESIKGMPRALLERRGNEILDAIRRGQAVAEDSLPRFPKSQRWERDPDFEPRVNALRSAREKAAQRLNLDPGVLCSREKLEAIARKKPATLEELSAIEGLRRWQVTELGTEFLKAGNRE